MKKYETIELVCKAETEESVRKRIATTGVRGLSLEIAQEKGLFKRISLMLSAMELTFAAGKKIFKNVDEMLDEMGIRKKDMAKACNEYEKAARKFFGFWKEFSANNYSEIDKQDDEYELYKNIMRWAMLPVDWNLGEEQFVRESDVESSIVIDDKEDESILRLSKSIASEEVISCEESWCVTRYDVETKKQECVYSDMDKASALMTAKRLSDDDKESIYAASQVLDVKKRETIVTPAKAFKANETIGKVSNRIKM
jgi:hypothetical protein